MYYYLASPYSGTPEQQEDRYRKAELATALFLKKRIPVYSPIVHCHYLAKNHVMPGTIEFWRWYNECMLTDAEQMWILTIPGWEFSKGVASEREMAEEKGKPIALVTLRGNTVHVGEATVL